MSPRYPAFIRNPHEIIRFYKQQLKKFKELGIGKQTEFGVRVTKKLIAVTNKRLNMLAVKMYEA